MKREPFIRDLVAAGYLLKRHGHKHDIYFNPQNGKQTPIACHQEIKDSLCRLINKQWDR